MITNNYSSSFNSFNNQNSPLNSSNNNSGEQRMVSFQEAIQMGFEKYACFTGRSSRSEYWWWALFCFLVGIAASIVDVIIGFDIVSGICSLGLLIPNMSIFWRRLHNIGKPGTWWCLSLIPFALGLILLVKAAFLSTHYYGSDLIVSELATLTIVTVLAALVIGVLFLVWCATPSQNYANKYGDVPNLA